MGIKKFFVLAIIITVLLTLGLSACRADGKPDETTTATALSQTPEIPSNTPPLILAKDGKSEVVIVYPTKSSQLVIEEIDKLKDTFLTKYGISVSAFPDSLYEPDASKLELLIGNTKDDASLKAINSLEKNSCSVSVSDKKIVVAANHTYLIPVALDSLSGALTYENGTVSLDSAYSFTSESYKTVDISVNNKTDHRIVYETSNEDALKAAEDIRLAFQYVGVSIDVIYDKEPISGKEILI